VTFLAHGAGAAIELAALAERHEGASTLGELDRAARSLAAWAKSQRKWLDRHAPQACYADVHKVWRQGVVDLRQGARSVRQSIARLEAAPMRRAVRKLVAGSEKLTGVDLDQVSRDCVAASGVS
jgi:hypothetical protein